MSGKHGTLLKASFLWGSFVAYISYTAMLAPLCNYWCWIIRLLRFGRLKFVHHLPRQCWTGAGCVFVLFFHIQCPDSPDPACYLGWVSACNLFQVNSCLNSVWEHCPACTLWCTWIVVTGSSVCTERPNERPGQWCCQLSLAACSTNFMLADRPLYRHNYRTSNQMLGSVTRSLRRSLS